MAQVLIANDYDPITGFHEEFWFDAMEGKVHIKRYQYIQGVLDANKRLFNDAPTNYSKDNGAFLKARIPNSVIEKWLREDGFNWYQSSDKERRAKLNDRDNRKFLVRPGRM